MDGKGVGSAGGDMETWDRPRSKQVIEEQVCG